MSVTPLLPHSAADLFLAPLEQIHVTHCLYDEGVYRQAGFSVRAASTRDPLLLRFALEYPRYELPVALQGGNMPASATPRRLALVRIPGGHSSLVHSVYLPEDERGRANNFFSHFLIRPGLSAAEALATWASPDWVIDCPPDAARELPPLVQLPANGTINDEAVTAFLQADDLVGDQDLATLTCPPRLAQSPEQRRELVAQALRGCLLALQAGPTDARSRFYLLAEPGLTALLLYAAARLLPPALAGKLTFSTYENAQRGLHTFKHAQVIGTYIGDPEKGLEDELFRTRGYALDTFSRKCSPELAAEGDEPIEEWLELAARGEWATIEKVQRLQGESATSLVTLKDALLAARLGRRLAAGQADLADLLALKRSRCGAPLLEQYRDRVWPLVRDGSLVNSRMREEFGDLLREHLPELEQRAAEALRVNPPANWQPHWRLLWSLLADDPARGRETFQRILPEPPYASGLRFAVLHELQNLDLSPLDPRVPLHALLRNCMSEDLEEFTRSSLPREWFVLALCYSLLRSEPRAAAAQHLHAGDAELVRTFWQQFKLLKDEGQRRTILAPLFPPGTPEAAQFLSRLLHSRVPLRPDTLEWLLSTLGTWDRDWEEFWGRDHHLVLLLDMLRELGTEAAPVWDRLCSQINGDVLLLDEPAQQRLLLHLAAVRDRPGPALPPPTVQAIADWVLLREHFEKACAVPEEVRRQVIDACNRRGLDPIQVLGRYFERFVQPRGLNQAVLDDFAGFFHTFYPEAREYPDYNSRLMGWAEVVQSCPDEKLRTAYETYYITRLVPTEFRERLLQERRGPGVTIPAGAETPPLSEQAHAVTPPPGSTPLPSQPLFQLIGVHPVENQGAGLVCSLWTRFPWLLVTLGGGLLAAFVVGLYQLPPPRAALTALFVPVVLALTESVALQSVGLTVRSRPSSWRSLLLELGKELLVGVLLGIAAGLLAGGAALGLWAVPERLALCLGGTVAGGVVGAAVVGFLLPALLGRLGQPPRLAAGPTARALTGPAALLLYFTLARWLLR